MQVGIIGDGIAGRTLHRLLKLRGVSVELYGEEKQTRCKARPCGFGTSADCIKLVSRLGILPKEYVLRHDDYIRMNGRKIKGDLYWIDKPKLLKALSTDVRYGLANLGDYEVVVDATGVRRALSPNIPEAVDKRAMGFQHRAMINGYATPTFDPIKGGYLWTIPLGENEAHIGGGSTILPVKEVELLVLNRVREMKPNKIVCYCSEPIRLSGPLFPVVHENVITVGESAGLVVPFGGAGIHTAFESAIILAEQICKGDLARYDKAIRRRFGKLNSVRRIVDTVEKGRFPPLGFRTANWALRYQGLKPTLMDLLYIRRNLIEANK